MGTRDWTRDRSRPGLARELVWPGSHWLPRWPFQCRDSAPLDHYNAIRCQFPSPPPSSFPAILNMTLLSLDVKPSLTLIDSPVQEQAALPTPPFSPPQTLTDAPADTSVVLLNSLVSFYQQESLWVHRTRAGLELALTAQGRDSITAAATAKALSSSTDSSAGLTEDSDLQSIKAEPTTPPPSLGKVHPKSRWMQRKQSFKLRLEGIGPHNLHRRQRRMQRDASSEAGTRLLELFGQLMEARMESCHRVNRLVREANRIDLYRT
ncbi:hypothetical protein F5888DRAFT_1650586 [Russula emetica]|nr:hypothetical protein F5888DRAFT_1650586 [Russula emetica]